MQSHIKASLPFSNMTYSDNVRLVDIAQWECSRVDKYIWLTEKNTNWITHLKLGRVHTFNSIEFLSTRTGKWGARAFSCEKNLKKLFAFCCANSESTLLVSLDWRWLKLISHTCSCGQQEILAWEPGWKKSPYSWSQTWKTTKMCSPSLCSSPTNSVWMLWTLMKPSS